jgi:glycosyltransferase involved in cell wall biosynthesis
LGEQVRAALFYPFFMQKIVAQRVDQVVAVSPKGRHDVARSFDLPLERVALVRNGVDTETFKKKADVERRDDRILFVGDTEDRNKGFEYLLMAVHMLDLLVPAEVVVVQRSWSRKALILAREFGLEGRVTFVDSLTVEELVGEYNRATMLVSPSLYEGFGLPAAEAQACGTPVIATTAGAFAEIVDDETGRIVPPGDAAALAEAIRELLLDADLRESMGRAAEQRIRERFSWRRAAEMMDAIYRGEPQRTECMMVAS